MEPYSLSNTTLVTKEYFEELKRKAQAFDNYMVDLSKTMEEYPHNYIKSDNFAKETF